MSKKNQKTVEQKVAEVVAENLPEVSPEQVAVAVEVTNWDRTITPKEGAVDDVKFDFERPEMKGAKCDGVRYARVTDKGCVMQVRIWEGIERHWWTVKDAMDSGVLPEEYAKFKGYFVEYDAKIARVEMMEKMGLDVPTGVALAYADGVKAKKDAIAKRNAREEKIVNDGKEAYTNKAKKSAGERFDEIERRVNERKAK